MSEVQPGASATTAEQATAATNEAAEAAQQAVNAEQASQEQATGTQQADPNTEQGDTTPEGIDALPAWAQKEIRAGRKGEAKYRTRAKEYEDAVSTAQAEKDELIQQVGKAFGFIKDEDTEQVQADQLVDKLTQERDGYQQQLRELKQGAAIRDAADAAKVTDKKLLEAVLRSDNAFNELDINADDFNAQVAARVNTAIESHPALAQVAPTASGVDTSTTNRGSARKLTQEDLDRMFQNGEHAEINKAFAEGRFNLS